MKWQFKCIKNSLFGLIPFPYHVRRIKRYFKPYQIEIKDWWLDQSIEQIQMIKSINMTIADKVVLELGTGWQPIIPIIFYLLGAKKIILVDSQRLIDKKLLMNVINDLKKYKFILSDRLNIPDQDIEKRLFIKSCDTLESIFNNFNMEYLAPYDARHTKLADCYVDIITSRAVLEHIPPKILEEILKEFKRILNNDGVMCHIIDNSDHWEHKDKSITRLNYLKYEDWIWKLTAINPLDYQNRMRHCEYIEMFNKTGFKVIADYSKTDEAAMNDLKKIKICKKYKNMSYKELGILTSKILVKKNEEINII